MHMKYFLLHMKYKLLLLGFVVKEEKEKKKHGIFVNMIKSYISHFENL